MTPAEGEAESNTPPESTKREARARWQAMRDELAHERPFRQLSREERRERLRRLQGIGRRLLSSSEEVARRKVEEVKIEETNRATDELVKRYKRRALIEAINRAHEEDPPTAEEKELLQDIREKQRKLLESES